MTSKKEITWNELIKELSSIRKRAGKPSSLNDVKDEASKEWQKIKDGIHEKYIKGKPKPKPRKGHKGAPSITRPGHIDFRTHKGDKYYHRDGHLFDHNEGGIVGRPYTKKKTKKHSKKHSKKYNKKHSKKVGRKKKSKTRKKTTAGTIKKTTAGNNKCGERLAEAVNALAVANTLLSEAKNENSRLAQANVKRMNLQGQIQNSKNQVEVLEKQVANLQQQVQTGRRKNNNLQRQVQTSNRANNNLKTQLADKSESITDKPQTEDNENVQPDKVVEEEEGLLDTLREGAENMYNTIVGQESK